MAVGDDSASSPCRLPRGQGLGLHVPVMWLAPCTRVLPAVTKGLSRSRLLNVNTSKGLEVSDESLLSPLLLGNPGQETDRHTSGGCQHSRHAGNHEARGAWCHAYPGKTVDVDADKNTSLIVYVVIHGGVAGCSLGNDCVVQAGLYKKGLYLHGSRSTGEGWIQEAGPAPRSPGLGDC